ncbi:DUF1990 domain-containing protein [Nocardioides zeae]|uniref:DUF1990 domain-containing protein n=1 Tax=Nocardioides imazamoxiresistens TaxID=3231893 RepID=A0ABU3PYY1_9ACTN|nr:DUF1990 domain-containing protein [Nocardioides zeae]MDT9594445.1 DUF1990 domain-containing protein [Nocardioides zeae]
MSSDELPTDRAAVLRLRGLTYDASLVGRSLEGAPDVEGYASLHRARVVGHGAEAFAAARAALDDWQVQRRSGLRVLADGPALRVGTVAVVHLGAARLLGGRLAVAAPTRVVAVVDDERRAGFAYGTLPGHPEAGEEAFVLTLADDGVVRFRVSAFSRPATRWARLGGPVTAYVQQRVVERYLRSLEVRGEV